MSPDRDPAAVRAAAHEDSNLLTILCEATAGGLELLQRDGQWRPIHALHGQFVVDSGDMIQHCTNGLLRSTTHRVVNPDKTDELVAQVSQLAIRDTSSRLRAARSQVSVH